MRLVSVLGSVSVTWLLHVPSPRQMVGEDGDIIPHRTPSVSGCVVACSGASPLEQLVGVQFTKCHQLLIFT